MLSSRAVRVNTDGPYIPVKTPGRDLRNRLENANAIPSTVRGKNILFPKTPLQPVAAQSNRLFKDQKSNLGTVTRPLGDKTPLPNRLATVTVQSPLDSKISKPPSLQVTTIIDDGSESMQRPSSLRKHLKLPRNSGPKNFETPMNNGRHWDISDGDIDVPNLHTTLEENSLEGQGDLDEIEYCAQNTLDLPYQPPFDFELPDYKQVGKTIRHLAFSAPVDDFLSPPEPDFPSSQLEQISWNLISLQPLESDDPFDLARLKSNESKKPAVGAMSAKKIVIPSHRRVQSLQARLGPSGAPRRPTGKTSTTSATAASLQMQPTLNVENRPSKSVVPTGPVKSSTITKKPLAAPAKSRTGLVRPHTSLSLASKSKVTSMAQKSLVQPPAVDIIVKNQAVTSDLFTDDNFMFNV